MINPAIFREYDIRGIAEIDLNDENVELLGLGLGTYYRRISQNRVIVGGDVRLSTPRIRERIIKSLQKTGCDVIDIGQAPTPVLYFSLFHYDIPNGIMVTASHNPKEFNGFKVCAHKTAIYGDEIQKIRRLIESGDFSKGNGICEKREIIDDYINYITSGVNISKGLKVVVDTGNGICGPIMEKILKRLGVEFEILYKEPDGNFPNHLPDPTVEKYIKELIERTKTGDFHLGIGIDGDGDRIGVVNENGEVIWGDMLLAIFAQEVLKKQPGAKIIFEVKCSKGLIERIEELGGIPIMYRTGHSLIKAKMKQENAPLAGEMSGHIFFADRYFGYDDAIYASLRLMEILSGGRKLSELVNEFPRYFSTPEIRVDTDDNKKFLIVERLKERFKGNYKIIDIDGVRVDFGDGWGLVRASNTQPVLVLRFEAKTRERLEEIKSLFFEKLEEIKGE
uniref:Phosphomannomutase/phosphoglucomutase n=1 Tax=candidate division WOR-3 bacterium TaxID=2052148 RepID=A0A7V3VTW8_UNCW3